MFYPIFLGILQVCQVWMDSQVTMGLMESQDQADLLELMEKEEKEVNTAQACMFCLKASGNNDHLSEKAPVEHNSLREKSKLGANKYKTKQHSHL